MWWWVTMRLCGMILGKEGRREAQVLLWLLLCSSKDGYGWWKVSRLFFCLQHQWNPVVSDSTSCYRLCLSLTLITAMLAGLLLCTVKPLQNPADLKRSHDPPLLAAHGCLTQIQSLKLPSERLLGLQQLFKALSSSQSMVLQSRPFWWVVPWWWKQLPDAVRAGKNLL